MKRLLAVLTVAAIVLTGCGSLIPKKVEFFQRKVKAFPEVTQKQQETQREAAAYIEQKTEELKLAGIALNQPSIVTNATEANDVANALSTALGPPEDPWQKEASKLAAKLRDEQADHNADLQKFKKYVDQDTGKKIEGTGLIRIPYFLYIGLVIGVFFVVWTLWKWYASSNPILAAGTNAVGRVSSSVLSRGYAELVQGGEAFKGAVENSALAADVKAEVLKLFRSHQRQEQSQDTQQLVSTLTK